MQASGYAHRIFNIFSCLTLEIKTIFFIDLVVTLSTLFYLSGPERVRRVDRIGFGSVGAGSVSWWGESEVSK